MISYYEKERKKGRAGIGLEWEDFAGRKMEWTQRFRRQDLLLAPAAKALGSLSSSGLDESEECREHHGFH